MNILRYRPPTNLASSWRQPWGSINRFGNELEQWLGPQFGRLAETSDDVADWSPAVDIKEDEQCYTLRADIPGVDPKNIEITMENGGLLIRGNRQTETTEDQDGYRR
ncbi:MAG: Hsp20/alpha crystallin family protein, partial [Gammaproteobacteria bacterium]|nr:Hsp20/alpha crystallin family protein [Gammaproteobacteria bacterium]